MRTTIITLTCFLVFVSEVIPQDPYTYSWRYYNTGNTGIQGDYVEAIWIDHDGDPYLAGYTPGFEEGGFAKLIQAENRWINYSNVDYPVIGNINDVGSSRISDIEEDANGLLWMATWRGILKFNPSVGGSSLEFWGANNSIHPGGRSRDLAIAPDGSIWIAVISVTWGDGGLVNYNPNTNVWRYWGYGTTANNWPPLIPFLINVSIQEKPNGGYLVWAGYESIVVVFDSDTQLFTQLPNNGNPGEVIKLPGNDCVDDLQNLWAIRVSTTPGTYSLDYITQSGSWVTPTQPPVSSLINDIWSFKAYGNNQALLIDGNSVVWKFNGTSWQNLGAWKDGAFSYGIDIDENGNIWATGVGGAAKRDAQTGTWQRYRITNSSQIDYWVNDISIDDQGNVWMTGNGGSGVGGFQKFDGTRWTGYNNANYGLGYPFPFQTDNTEVIYYRPSNGTVVINPMFGYLHAWNGSNYTSLNYPNDRSEGVVEDSQNRLWSLGEYYNLKYYSNNTWTTVPFDGWGYKIAKDPSRPGTIWASSGFQALRTDGSYNFTRYNTDFPELDPQSDLLTTVAADLNGIAWVGSNKGLFKLNANDGTYQFYSPSNSQIPGDNISPLLVTPDGRLWFANFQSTTTSTYGLCWFDGTNFGIIPQQQTGGLPHAQIYDIEMKNIQNGYELWISCASRGVAVLTVTGTIIPVELSSFSAAVNGNNVTLNWSTATETNNSGFYIERSVISNEVRNLFWESISFVNGTGTTTETQSYSFVDNNLSSGTYLYRLKQIDFDGTVEYTNTIDVEINAPTIFSLEQNYPNPFNPLTVISYQLPVGGNAIIKVYDILGNEVATLVNEQKPAGSYNITFDASTLPSGIYMYQLQAGSFSQSKKMILIK
ncbi:MAG TPA: T9SS type A sorting domain-containing protein [Ignavibacteriaceae bacterium]|nr:T9SS type A sorting domain-containing protein [Ignavibacteriaceae bacterium]